MGDGLSIKVRSDGVPPARVAIGNAVLGSFAGMNANMDPAGSLTNFHQEPGAVFASRHPNEVVPMHRPLLPRILRLIMRSVTGSGNDVLGQILLFYLNLDSYKT